MTIFDALKLDHRKVSALFLKLQRACETESHECETLFDEIKEELMIHAASEEDAVYAPLRLKDSAHEKVMEAAEEHELIDRLLHQLSQMSAADDSWKAKVAVLKDLVEHHVHEEEGELFKLMRKSTTRAELDEMLREFSVLRKENQKYVRGYSDATSEQLRSQ